MKTLHIMLRDRMPELQKDVPDDFKLDYPDGIAPTTNSVLILPDLFVNLSQVVAMWVTKEED